MAYITLKKLYFVNDNTELVADFETTYKDKDGVKQIEAKTVRHCEKLRTHHTFCGATGGLESAVVCCGVSGFCHVLKIDDGFVPIDNYPSVEKLRDYVSKLPKHPNPIDLSIILSSKVGA